MGFFGKPKPGPPPPRPSSSLGTMSAAAPPSSSPTSTTLRTPSSAAGSSPATRAGAAPGRGAGTGAGDQPKRQGSPLKSSFTLESDGELSPPPEDVAVVAQAEVHIEKTALAAQATRSTAFEAEEDVEMAPADGSPIVLVSSIRTTSRLDFGSTACLRLTRGSHCVGTPNKAQGHLCRIGGF